MVTMLVVVQAMHPYEVHNLLFGNKANEPLAAGVKQVHATAWTVELPKCTEFFATLLQNVARMKRTYVVAELAEGTDPYCSLEPS